MKGRYISVLNSKGNIFFKRIFPRPFVLNTPPKCIVMKSLACERGSRPRRQNAPGELARSLLLSKCHWQGLGKDASTWRHFTKEQRGGLIRNNSLKCRWNRLGSEVRLRANRRNNSQHCCANNFGSCCVRVGSGKTACKRMQQLPTMLGPAVHRGKKTTYKSL